jgi:hypothetical protein
MSKQTDSFPTQDPLLNAAGTFTIAEAKFSSCQPPLRAEFCT